MKSFVPSNCALLRLLLASWLIAPHVGLQAACTPPPAGLVAWWPGEGNALDIAGANNGTLLNGVTFAPGVVGQGFRFDGTNSFMQVPDAPTLKPTSVTVEAWVWLDPNTPSAGSEVVVFKRNSWTFLFEGYTLVKDHADNGNGTFSDRFAFVVTRNGNQVILRSTTVVQRGVWYHVAGTYDGNQSTIIVNGVAEGSLVAGFPLDYGTLPVCIGASGEAPPYQGLLGGIIDEPSIYNRALSSNEIAAIYNAGAAGKCSANSVTNTAPTNVVPVIASFAPTVGVSGSLVTLVGTNFSATASSNIVYFGAVRATVLAASTSSLTVTVPAGATHAPLTVAVGGLMAYSSAAFEPTFFGTGAAISAATLAPGTNLSAASPITTVIADLDGDGKPDLVVDDVYANAISIFQNTGSNGVLNASSFAAPVTFFVGSGGDNPLGLTIADVDGDGRLDLLVPDRNGNQIAIFRNVSAGGILTTNSFAAPVFFPTGVDPRRVAVADLDGDGRSEIISANGSGGSVSILRNIGSAGSLTTNSFAAHLDLPAVSPENVAIGDLDGDGKPDLAMSDNTGLVSLYRNNCTVGNISLATFDPRVDLAAQSYTMNLVLGDLDGDGKMELIATAYLPQTMSVYRNQATPGSLTTNSFAAPVTYALAGRGHTLALGDLNGDGQTDIAEATELGDALSIFQNVSSGSFTNTSLAARVDFATGWNAWGVAVGDLDGDGRPDAVLGNVYDNTLTLYKNLSPFVTNAVSPRSVLVDNSTVGFYNASLGTGLDGTEAQFPTPGNDPTIFPATEPTLAAAAAVLGNWLVPQSVLNGNWLAPAVIPSTWALNSETAIIYEVNAGPNGFANLLGDFDADNGLYVWVNGQYKFGARAPGLPSPLGQFEYTNVNLGNLAPGTNRIQIIREDSGIATGYQIRITGLALTNPPPVAPLVVTQPTNLTVTVNTTASFNVAATGTQPLFYQWSFNGTNLLGATNTTLTLTNVLPARGGNYSVFVSNFVGTATSSNATLTVYVPPTPPILLAQTPSQVVLLGSSAILSVTVGGSDPLSYFWSRNNVLISGATNAFYVFTNAQLADSGSQFNCLVTNAFGTVTSTNVSLKVIDTLANDLCSGAILITNSSYTNAQSTVRASSFGDPQPGCVTAFGNGVWYQFTAPVSGRLVLDTFGSDYDTGLAIYTGACGELSEVACNDDSGGPTSQLTWPTIAGVTYAILAGGYNAHVGNLVLHLNHFTPPAFDLQPTNLSVVVSSNATFVTTVSGTQPISLQWYFNNAPLTDGGRISGATNATLNLANIGTNDGGNYVLVASNFVGVTTSSVAMLTPVVLPPVFVLSPVSQSVITGSNVTFTAQMDGTPPYSFVWSFNGSPLVDNSHLSGAAAASLSISNLTTADAGSYTLTVANSGGTTNLTVNLTVLVPPSITLNPISRSVPPGLPTTFTASASGIGTPTYQWQLNGTNIPGATSANYFIAAVGTNDLGFYHLVATNAVGSAVSADAQLTFGVVAAWGRNLNNECLPPPNLTNVTAVAGTMAASFALLTDGRLSAWGSGSGLNVPTAATNVVALAASGSSGLYALRSDGRVVGWNGPQPPSLSNIVAVAAGNNFGYALRAEGTLTNWGTVPSPGFSPSLNQIMGIACGYNCAIALRNDGTIAVNGLAPFTNVPSSVTNVVAVAVGNTFALALKANGTLVAWGSGTITNLPPNLTNIVAISASGLSGENFGVAIRANGKVMAWGDNSFGETNAPTALGNLISVGGAAAPYHGMALVNDGRPLLLHQPIGLTAFAGRDVTLRGDAVGSAPLSYQWLLNGTNLPAATNPTLALANIQLANTGNYQLFVSNALGTAISLTAPVNISSNNTLVFLSQTTNSLTNYQGATITTGSFTVLGNGPLRYQWFASPTNSNYLAVAGATNETLTLNPALSSQSGNYYLAVSILFAGVTSLPVNIRVQFAKAWGFGAVTNPPVNVTNAIALATGGATGNLNTHYLALGADGKLTSWANYFPSYGETNVAALSNSLVTAIAASYQHSLTLKSDGTVYAWGYGGYGQTNPPVNLSGVTAIACGGYHDLALKNDGTVVGWGATLQSPNYGQATNNPAATNVIAIAAGNVHSLALRADGTVVAWGNPADGSTTIPNTATNLIAIAAGNGISAGLRNNGTVVQWGNSISGYPVPANLSNVVAISAAGTHVSALKNDGSVVSWGYLYISPASNSVPTDVANVSALTSGGDHDFALFGTRAPSFTVQPWNRTVSSTTTSVFHEKAVKV